MYILVYPISHIQVPKAIDLQRHTLAHFVPERPLYNPIRLKFPSLFENVGLGSLQSFFQINHHVGISLYLMEATADPPL